MENMITMEGICKSYQMGEEKLQVLKNISLTVEKGDFVAILGPSGSGKSTLMNIVGCMDHCEEGEYILDGHEIHRCTDRELTDIRNREIGFIFQKYHLIPRYTVIQNIIMPLIIRGMDHREAQRQCEETIEMLGLAERTRTPSQRALRRPAAEGSHCQSAGGQSGHPAGGRTHRSSGQRHRPRGAGAF